MTAGRWAGHRLGRVLVWVLLGVAFQASGAVDPALQWRTISSEHFDIHYPKSREAVARRALNVAEVVQKDLGKRLGWTPEHRTQIVLSDETDFPNGWSTPLPFNHEMIFPIPADDTDALADFDDWLKLLITHEYTHTLHLDMAGGIPRALRNVFGREVLLFPNIFQPSWMIEGLAVYMETDPKVGVGRGQSTYYDMLMRMEVEGGLKPFDEVSMSGVAEWPAGQIPYLYGAYFYEYMAEHYGESRIQRLIHNYSDNLIPFLIGHNMRGTVGKGLIPVWNDYQAELRRRFQGELKQIRAAGLKSGERLTWEGYRLSTARAAGNERVYYVRYDLAHSPKLMVLQPGGKPRAVTELRMGARIDVNARGTVLIAQPEVCDNRNTYYDLYRFDPENDSSPVRLTRCGRYHFAAWGPDGGEIVASKDTGAGASLVRLDRQGQVVDTLWSGNHGEVLSELDWSADGRYVVAALWRPRSGWNLERFDVTQRGWTALTDDTAIEGQPQFSADGRQVLFTSEHGGVYNLREIGVDGGAMRTLTNVEGGAFSPTQVRPGGEIFYLGYGPKGFDLYRLRPPFDTRPTPPAGGGLMPAPVKADEPPATTAEARDYSPWSTLRPWSWTPTLYVGPDVTEVGAATYGQDALGLHQWTAQAAYETHTGNTSGALSYVYDQRYRLTGARYYTYDYDGSDLQRIRRHTRAETAATLPWVRWDYTLALSAGVGWQRETDAQVEPGYTGEGDQEYGLGGLAATFESTRLDPRAISRDDGVDLRLVAEDQDLLPGDYSGEVYTADLRGFLPLGGRHVLALRLAEGWGTENPRPFELGGSRGRFSEVLEQTFLFNRREFPLRGYPQGGDGLTGRRMQLASVEWRFPIADIERSFRKPPLGLHRLHGRLALDAGGAWNDGSRPDRYLTGVAAELAADTNLFYLLNLQVVVGVAHGFRSPGENQAYLTLGSAF